MNVFDNTVMVRFGGDTGQFNTQMGGAARTVRDTTQTVKDSIAQMNGAFAQLSAQMAEMTRATQATAGSTRTLESYANWGFALNVLQLGYRGVTGAATGTYSALNAVPEVMQKTEQAAQAAARSFADYAKNAAYSTTYGPLVKVANDGMIASYGRLIEKIDDYFARVDIIKSKMSESVGLAIAAAGAMDRFAGVAKDAGFDTAKRAIDEYIFRLTKIPGVTAEVAAGIVSSFGSIKELSAPLMDSMVEITKQMSSSKEEAQQFAERMASAFRDPATSGQAFLNSLGATTEALRQQYRAAQQNNDTFRMQSTIMLAIASQERNLMDERLRKLREQLQAYAEMGPLGRFLMIAITGQIREAEKAKQQFEEQAAALEKAAAALQKMTISSEQLRQNMNGVAQAFNPLSTQLDKVAGQIATLRAGLQGSTGDTAVLIRQFEGFRAKAYWDVNAYRAGYGSDTKTNADGSVEKVTKDTVVTREDAERDLARRIVEFQEKAAETIGGAWNGLSDKAKASITSVTYNYGSTPGSVVRAAKSGDESSIADAIRGLSANPGRRSQEAANITSDTMSGASAKEKLAAQEALDKALDTQRQINQSVSGGTEMEKARAQNIRESMTGKKDEVAEQERIVKATKDELNETHDAQNQQRLKNTLLQEEATLVQKKRELKKSELQLELADAETPEQTLAAKKKLYDYEQSLVARNSAQWNQIEGQKKAAQQEYDRSENEAERQKAESARAIALRELEEKRTILREQVQEGQISHTQLLAADIVLENQRTAVERDYWQKMKELATEGTNEYKQIILKQSQIDVDASARRQKTVSRDMQMIVRDYKQAFDQIGSSITSSLMGMIQGTEKFSGLLKNVALRIVEYFISAGVKMVTTWLANEAAKTVATTTGEAARTGAVVAGTSARTGAEQGAAAASLATKIAGVIKNIISSAAETFAGVFAFLSPVMGPAAAGPAGAAMGAVMSMTSIASADIGMWKVPQDQIAAIHRNELIMPARESEALRDLLSSGGGTASGRGGNTSNTKISVSAMDARGVRSVFERNDRELVRTLEKASRRGIGGRK